MPKCCTPSQFTFANASNTSILYDVAMRNKYGTQPKVFVWYYDAEIDEYYLSTFLTVIKFNGTNIDIDHGGPNSGIVIVT